MSIKTLKEDIALGNINCQTNIGDTSFLVMKKEKLITYFYNSTTS